MVDWLTRNRSWLFSGCGVAALTMVFGLINLGKTPGVATNEDHQGSVGLSSTNSSPGINIQGSGNTTSVANEGGQITITNNNPEPMDFVNDSPPPPKVGHFETKFGDHTYVIFERDGVSYPAQITLIIDVPREYAAPFDHYAIFDVTNEAVADLRITGITFTTTEWKPLEEFTKYVPYAGIEPIEGYFGLIDKQKKSYRFSLESGDNVAHVLKGKELDTISLAFTAISPGVYSGYITLEYSVHGKLGTVEIGRLDSVRFVDRDSTDEIPRGEEEDFKLINSQLINSQLIN